MKTLLLSASALVITGGIALAQTPSTTAPSNQNVTDQMQGSTSAPMVAPTGGGAAANGAIVNGQQKPSFDSQALGKVQTPSDLGKMPVNEHAGEIVKHGAAASGDATFSSTHAEGSVQGSASTGAVRVPTLASVTRDLEVAHKAVARHERSKAHLALAHAENELTTHPTMKRMNGHVDTAAAATVRQAEHAVTVGEYSRASTLIEKAMKQARGQA